MIWEWAEVASRFKKGWDIIKNILCKYICKDSAAKGTTPNDSSTNINPVTNVTNIFNINAQTGSIVNNADTLYEKNGTTYLPLPQDEAKKRVHKFNDIIFNELIERNPNAINDFNSPVLQDVLFKAQKSYVLNEDPAIGELLIDILVERAANTQRNTTQISLTEALDVLPKLTTNQLNMLTLSWLLKPDFLKKLSSYDEVMDYIENTLYPLAEKIETDYQSEYRQLEYFGCFLFRSESNTIPIDEILYSQCREHFYREFTPDEIKTIFKDFSCAEQLQELFTQSIFDSQKYQFKATPTELYNLVKEFGITGMDQLAINEIIKARIYMDQDKIRINLIQKNQDGYIKLDNFSSSQMLRELTNVGIVIAQANIRRMKKGAGLLLV